MDDPFDDELEEEFVGSQPATLVAMSGDGEDALYAIITFSDESWDNRFVRKHLFSMAREHLARQGGPDVEPSFRVARSGEFAVYVEDD